LQARLAKEQEVASHTAARIQKQDQPNGLRAVIEEGEWLGFAVVEDTEVISSEGRDESVALGDGHKQRHGFVRGPEHGTLSSGDHE